MEGGADALARSTASAWELVAAKYAPEVESDVALLRGGGTSLLPVELALLAPLLRAGGRAVHLQCSHGLDALSLWRLGATEVVGLDASARMLALAARKAELLGAPASWVQADVLAPPARLAGTADLLYTGKGALPWVRDIERWAAVVAWLLAPGGRAFIYEGHPLNWVLDPSAADVRLRAGASYFDSTPRANDDFPGRFLAGLAEPGGQTPTAWEHQWTLGDVVSALIAAGLECEHLREHPEHFWPQFPAAPPADLARLPHTFSLLVRRRAT